MRLAAVLAAALCGCAGPALEGAPRVESRRFTVTSDVDPGALELALPILDAVDEELTKRWGFEDRGRRELLLFADETTWDAFEAAEKPDGERWHGSGFGHDGAIALEVPPRSRGEDLSQVSFDQVRRLDDAVEVVSRVTRELFLCRLREHLGPKAFKARHEFVLVGAGEVERTAAMARLDGGLEAPYEPGRSEVERALGALADRLESRQRPIFDAHLGVATPEQLKRLERELALGLALHHEETQRRVVLLEGAEFGAYSSDALVLAAVNRLANVVLRHPSERYVRAAGPTLRIIAALRGCPEPTGADPQGWRAAAALLETELGGTAAVPGFSQLPIRRDDLDALLLELGVKESARLRWLDAFCPRQT